MSKPASNFFNHTFTSFSSTGQKVLQMGPSLTKLLPISIILNYYKIFISKKILNANPTQPKIFRGEAHWMWGSVPGTQPLATLTNHPRVTSPVEFFWFVLQNHPQVSLLLFPGCLSSSLPRRSEVVRLCSSFFSS